MTRDTARPAETAQMVLMLVVVRRPDTREPP
jgi:hypothetical protein